MPRIIQFYVDLVTLTASQTRSQLRHGPGFCFCNFANSSKITKACQIFLLKNSRKVFE
jgi:hypothetical protein